ncbi:hypothetical protein C8R43DRAFT_1239412, partial [Mycena crocata]
MGPCGAEFERTGFKFQIGQDLRLSLKGATIRKPNSATAKLMLQYPEGVVLEALPREHELRSNQCTIDTWAEPKIDDPWTHMGSKASQTLIPDGELLDSSALVSQPGQSSIHDPYLSSCQPSALFPTIASPQDPLHNDPTSSLDLASFHDSGAATAAVELESGSTVSNSVFNPDQLINNNQNSVPTLILSTQRDLSSVSPPCAPTTCTLPAVSTTNLDLPLPLESTAVKPIAQAQFPDSINCIVELLHVDECQRTIYITDYTWHPRIPNVAQVWADGLDGYVLKVVISDQQAEMLQHCIVGRFYLIMSLRLSSATTHLEGSLKQIHAVDVEAGFFDDWTRNIVRRRSDVAEHTSVTRHRAEPTLQIVPPTVQRRIPASVSIRQVLASAECPGIFSIRAQVVDFFPLRLQDSFVRICGRCHALIPKNFSACSTCPDIPSIKTTSILRFAVDDGEAKLKLSLSGNVKIMAMDYLHNIDLDGGCRLSEYLKPLLGNLEAVHEGIFREEPIDTCGSDMELIIDSWKGPDNTMVYGLYDFVLQEVDL